MKIINQTPFVDEKGELGFSQRLQGMLQFGLNWPTELKAQQTIANYFAAVEGAVYPYEFESRSRDSYLDTVVNQHPNHLRDALKIVTDNNYCVKCHNVADYRAPGRDRAKAPDLADVYRRFKPDYLRRWIAQPNMILPYTAMPVNVKYEPDKPHLGGVSQDLYHGTSVEQLDGLVDLLMNYDQYSRSSRKVADLVKPATVPAEGTPPAEGAPPAATGNSGE